MSSSPGKGRRRSIREAHEIIEEVLRTAGDQAVKAGETRQAAHARVAKALGVSTSLLYKWREPAEAGSGQPNPLARTLSLIEATRDPRIVEWICQRAGGRFENESTTGEADVGRAANALVRDFGLLIADVVVAADDRRIDAEESRQLRARWDRLRARAEGFVQTCERGGYEQSDK
jgi:transposase-like protein